MAGAEQHKLKEYLLDQLTEAEEEQVELRLLTDPDFAEEYDIVVNEITDDYIAGKFEGENLKQIEAYFFKPPERRQKLKFALALKQRKSELLTAEGHPKRSYRPYLAIAATLLLVVGGFYLWRLQFGQAAVDKGLVALNSAFREARPLEARISKFDYAPYVVTRSGEPARVNQNELSRAELALLQELKDKPSPATHHALGKVFLAKKEFDRAIEQFEEALKGDRTNAQLYSDLGAAWLEKGKIDLDKAQNDPTGAYGGNAVQEFGKALENIDGALKLNSSLPEAVFNRALYHKYMKLGPQEEADLREYINQEPNSQWADEARQRLRTLEAERKRLAESKEEKLERFRKGYRTHNDTDAWELVSSYQNRSGNLIVEQLLDAYLASAAGASDEASENLSSLKYAGNLSRERAGDSFFSDLVHFYAQAQPGQQNEVAQARAVMKTAHEGWGQAKVEDSLSSFAQAKEQFQRSGNYYESIVADYWVSFCYYRQNKLKESLAILEPLMQHCENKRYLWILNRLLYLMSIVQFKLNEQSRAMDFANRSADLAERIGDKVGMINALSSLIEYYRYLGDHQRAFNCIKRGFGVVDAIALDPVQGARHYGFAANAFASANLFAASADYQQMALQFALQSGRSATIAPSYAFLALTNWKLGNYDEARRNSQLAYDIAHSHSDGPDDRNLMAYASLQMANASRLAGDFNTAIENYTRSIQLYTALDVPTHLYQAHKGRMLCYLAENNDELTKDEISTAINLVETYRTKIFEGNSRDTFFDTEQQVYDTAIEFAYARMHDTDQAFQYSENSRGRSLLDLINADTPRVANERNLDLVFQSFSESLPLSEIKRDLPPEVRLVQYAVLHDRLLIWVVSPNGAESSSKSISASELTEKVFAYLSAVSAAPAAGQSSQLPVARELFDILIAPIESQLIGKEVCIVPDKVLNLLPFAALMSPAGRYFVEDHVLEISPSASAFIKCTEIARQKEGQEIERVLSVGNPAFDRDSYSYLSDLPSALREAKEIASLYGSRKPLIGAEATTDSVMAEMKGAEVIHFALHSVVDKQFPLRSKFVFAKSRGGSAETLSAYEVYAMTLPRTRLVVLSSCQSGVERYYKGEGMIGLARPFIAAQVPLVVASMWPIESDSSADIMISFHKHRAQEKASTAEALAAAQREMLRNPDERYRQPYYWAAFTVIGGHANF
jgi:CHAT domain-containing protein